MPNFVPTTKLYRVLLSIQHSCHASGIVTLVALSIVSSHSV